MRTVHNQASFDRAIALGETDLRMIEGSRFVAPADMPEGWLIRVVPRTYVATGGWLVTASGNVFGTSQFGDPEPFEQIGEPDGYNDALDTVLLTEPADLIAVADALDVIAAKLRAKAHR